MTKPAKTPEATPARRITNWLICLVVLGAIGLEVYSGFRVKAMSDLHRQEKTDYSIVNSISFGLLSVDSWKDEIVAAASGQINSFKLTPEQEADLRKEIEQVMHSLVDKAFDEVNKKQSTVKGKILKFAVKTFVDPSKIQNQVPGFANRIMKEVTKPSSYHRLAKIADTALAKMGRQTFDSSFAATKFTMDSLYKKYGVADKDAFDKKNAVLIDEADHTAYQFTYTMLGCVAFILLLWIVLRNRRSVHVPLYMLSVAAAMVLLAVGLTTTMIEVDARIGVMDFHLLGREIVFRNQVLFFQSKSIVDVVHVLIATGKIDSQIVGVMILVFSILFPFLKLSSTAVSLMSENKLAKNKVIYYFAHESGKWSMADVMVIALLMTYIGFNGIVVSTLGSLNVRTDSFTSITTNNTSIQPGYIIFISFVICGFVLSTILNRITRGFTVL